MCFSTGSFLYRGTVKLFCRLNSAIRDAPFGCRLKGGDSGTWIPPFTITLRGDDHLLSVLRRKKNNFLISTVTAVSITPLSLHSLHFLSSCVLLPSLPSTVSFLHEPLVLLRSRRGCGGGGGQVKAYRPHLAREQMGRTMVIVVDCVRMYPDIGPAGWWQFSDGIDVWCNKWLSRGNEPCRCFDEPFVSMPGWTEGANKKEEKEGAV